MTRLREVGLLIFRVGVGGLMLTHHGIRKVDLLLRGRSEVLSDIPFGFGPDAWLGWLVFAEFGCTILLVLGLMTRLAAIPLILSSMATVFVIHSKNPWGQELELVYLIGFVAVLLLGAGEYSVEAWAKKKK